MYKSFHIRIDSKKIKKGTKIYLNRLLSASSQAKQ